MPTNFYAIVPMACVIAAGIAAASAGARRSPGERAPIAALAVIGLAGAAIASVALWNRNASGWDVVSADNFSLFVTLLLVVIGLLTVAISGPVIDRGRLPAGEYHALVMFSLAGMMLAAAATDLLVIALALEAVSLPICILIGIRSGSPQGSAAAFRAFLIGSIGSAFFLYGIAVTYGVTGSTRLDRVGSELAAQAMAPTPLQRPALVLLFIGFALRVSLVPFHLWTADAYEGAPPAVAAFMSSGVKVAAFAAFARVFLSTLEPLRADWMPILAVVAAVTMIAGTIAACTQVSLRRMLAYLSLAHGGYLLLALISASDAGKSALLFSLAAYSVASLGAFGVLAVLEVEDYAGLGTARPKLAALMTIFLLSLGGLPPTAGFMAKWYMFSAAVRAGYAWLAIIGVLTSIVSVVACLRIVVRMYGTPADAPFQVTPISECAGAALILSAILIVFFGILPAPLMNLAAASIGTIF